MLLVLGPGCKFEPIFRSFQTKVAGLELVLFFVVNLESAFLVMYLAYDIVVLFLVLF